MRGANVSPSGQNDQEMRGANVSPSGRNGKLSTRREGTLLAIGALVGAIVVASIFVGQKRYVAPHEEAAAEAAEATGARLVGAVDDAGSNPDAASSVQLSDDEQKAIGVETVEVQRHTIRKEITVPGRVVEPESGIVTISARIGGRIEKLLVSVTGEMVRRGQPVALIYSPELVTAAEEYKLALENRRQLAASREPEAIAQADELVRASRRRLELRGLTAEQIEAMALSAEQTVQITTYSSVAGVITRRNVAEGQYVKEGDVLFELADLNTVWVQADIDESEISLTHAGQRVKIGLPGLDGEAIDGTISFLQPSVNPQNRTMAARIQVPNPQMRLRPGMFVRVAIQESLGADAVAVPRSAVLDTGKEKIVYVAKGGGVFEKRSVDATIAGDDYYGVTRGLKPGERVVTHGSFLIDSQTRLTGTITGMFGGSKAYGNDESAPQSSGSPYTITLRSEPAPPKGGSEGTFYVQIAGSGGKPVPDAQVRLTLVMPAMPSMGMGEMRSTTDLMWNGSEYVGKARVAMAGPWNVTVEARRDGRLLGIYRTRFEAK
jgi:Cu(I)/Ag(I) efflux system membrane fusion protein